MSHLPITTGQNSSVAFNTKGLSLVADIINSAMKAAKESGMPLPTDDKEARRLLGKRILLGIEAGETDADGLRRLALGNPERAGQRG